MGGAIGTPLLFTIILLVAALVCTVKKNQRKSNRGDPTQMTDIRMAETSIGMAKGSVEISLSPSIYNNESIYSTIHDEDRLRSAYDEYIDINPAYACTCT